MLGDGESEPWRLEGDQLSLLFTPAGPAADGSTEDGSIHSLDQLCAVSGTVTLDGSTHEVDCAGWRATLEGDVELSALDSFRQTSGWFEPGDGFALVALRPRRARGHDSDLVTAAVLDPEPSARIEDPRLSTTYDDAGLPRRVGLELWFELEASEPEPDPEAEPPPHRRAAAEAFGAALEWETAEFKLHAARLRWHSRGSHGVGIYLLGHRL